MKYSWAVIGYGEIALEMAEVLKKNGRTFYGIFGRSFEKALSFARRFGISKVYKNAEELFSDKAVDIVYIATPNSSHAMYITDALLHGKNVLCEKPIVLNSFQLSNAQNIAKKKNLILSEAMTLYHMPLYKNLQKRIQSGEFGSVKMIQVNFGSFKPYNPENRFFNPEKGGGALMDIGVYALSFARWFMTCAPEQISSQVTFAQSGVDEQSGILLSNSKNEIAVISLSFRAKQPKRGTVICENTFIEIYDFPRGNKAEITWTQDGKKEFIECGNAEDALFYEVLDMEKAILNSEKEMYLDYSQDVSDIMTKLCSTWNFSV